MKGTSLNRFVDAQEKSYLTAFSEIQFGKKDSDWIWFIFPQLRGLGKSDTSYHYGIENLQEAVEYLNHEVLGDRLIRITEELLFLSENNPYSIFGVTDSRKLMSSMTLFNEAAKNSANKTDVFKRTLNKFFGGRFDKRTIRMIQNEEVKTSQSFTQSEPKTEEKHYYKILGVSESASYAEIKEAYEVLSSTYNPSNYEGNEIFENLYNEILEAYSVLGDIGKRKEYDERGKIPVDIKEPSGEEAAELNSSSDEDIDYETNYDEEDAYDDYSEDNIWFKIDDDDDDDDDADDEEEDEKDEDFSHSSIDVDSEPPPVFQKEKLWSESGRIGRLDFFVRFICSSGIFTLILFIINQMELNDGMVIFSSLLGIIFLLFLFAQTAKRIQDIGYSGWWALIMLLFPIYPIAVIILTIIPGENRTNKYGLTPKP